MSIEYAIIIAVVVAALLAMFMYSRRVIQGKYRQSMDVFGEEEQYSYGE